MKKVLGLLLIIALLVVHGVAFANDYGEQDAAGARAYIERTDLTELFTRKNEDYPFELVLPDWVWKSLTEKEIHEEVYKKVGIDLKEEVELGRLYVKDGKYYINFKEKKIEKEIIKRQKRRYGFKLTAISLEDVLKVDGLNLVNCKIREIDDLRYLINCSILLLRENKQIIDYYSLTYLVKLKLLDIQKNNILEISIINNINPDIKILLLDGNNLKDASLLCKFPQLEILSLSNNEIISLKGLERLSKLEELSINGNPITLEGLKYIEQLCYNQVLHRLYIDRKVFKEYGTKFSLYPEYLQWIDRIYFYEEDGSVKEWY